MQRDYPHRRLNPLTGEWVLVSPHRARRPWQGQVEKTPQENLPAYDPACYLCPGNTRAGHAVNPPYTGTFWFDNDFAALLPPDQVEASTAEHRLPPTLFRAEVETGLCRVVCFSPRHDRTLPELGQQEVEEVVRTWTAQTVDLGKRTFVNYVQVFENKGAMMGCSNPHPHSQIWATSHIPDEPQKELVAQHSYAAQHGNCLLCAYIAAEVASGERVIAANDAFTAVVPYWAIWPFEVLLVSNRHCGALPDLSPAEVQALAAMLRAITARYDNLFEVSFPYSMGFHQSPADGSAHDSWHFHAHYYPPLLRSATVRKFMVGFELLGQPQRDLTPETAAERLRSLSEQHYRTTVRR